MKYGFVFVCQQGELELKAMLFAASLRLHLLCEHELIAALPIPEATWGLPSQGTTDFLRRIGVRLVTIKNPIGADYPIGNKISCLSVSTEADKIIFLDSDMLCLRRFGGDARFSGFRANIKPADLATSGAVIDRWGRVYAAGGSKVPDTRVRATVSGEEMPPYYNAGFVAVTRGVGVGEEWADCARRIDADPTIADKRPWLDQLALPVALERLGLAVDCLDERFNFPAHLKPIPHDELPWFVHYHSPEIIRSEPVANALVLDLADQHDEIRAALEAAPRWRRLLNPYGLRRDEARLSQTDDSVARRHVKMALETRPPELIITGIPRSGTSFLCALIHAIEDCVVINEPAEIFALLASPGPPWGMATYYRDLRREIRDGRPVVNKLHDGKFIEDTAVVDSLEEYVPAVSRPDFLLGTKNTLAYLARLPYLRQVMPEARIVACIRHPVDTIASWASTFDHLKRADFESQIVGNSRDERLTAAQRDRLAEIASAPSLARKRALGWRHLAETILESGSEIDVVRYEELVTSPVSMVGRILRATPNMFEVSVGDAESRASPRHREGVLGDEDLAEISAVCGDVAARLGYSL